MDQQVLRRRSTRRSAATALTTSGPDTPLSADQKCILSECGHDTAHINPDPSRDIQCEECWRIREELVDRLLRPLMEIMGPPLVPVDVSTGLVDGQVKWMEDVATRQQKQEQREDEKENIPAGKSAVEGGKRRPEACKPLLPQRRERTQRAALEISPSLTNKEKPLSTSSPLSSPLPSPSRSCVPTSKRPLEDVEDNSSNVTTPSPSRLYRGSHSYATSAPAIPLSKSSATRRPARKLRRLSPPGSSTLSETVSESSREPSIAPLLPASPTSPPIPTSVGPMEGKKEIEKDKMKPLPPNQPSIMSFFKPLSKTDSEKTVISGRVDPVATPRKEIEDSVAAPIPKIILGDIVTPSPPEKERKKRGKTKKYPLPTEPETVKGRLAAEYETELVTEEVATPVSTKKNRGKPQKSIISESVKSREGTAAIPESPNSPTGEQVTCTSMKQRKGRSRKSLVTDEVEAEQRQAPREEESKPQSKEPVASKESREGEIEEPPFHSPVKGTTGRARKSTTPGECKIVEEPPTAEEPHSSSELNFSTSVKQRSSRLQRVTSSEEAGNRTRRSLRGRARSSVNYCESSDDEKTE